MDIIIQSHKLLDLLKIVSGAICTTKKNDIFSHILIKKIENKLFCISINNEIEIVTFQELDNNDLENIDLIIKYDLIYNICKTLKTDDILKIKKTKNSINIETTHGLFKSPLLHSTNFPSFQDEKNLILNVQSTTSDLKELFYYPYITASENTQNLFLNGILIDINKNSINATASTGDRSAFSQILQNKTTDRLKIIIPRTIIKEFLNIYKNNEPALLKISESYIKIVTHKVTLTTKLINDTYENNNIKISSEKLTVSIINTIDFKKALTLINTICYNNNILTLSIKHNTIIVIAKFKSEFGMTKINAKSYGTELDITLNYKCLANILKIIKSEDIKIIITNKHNQIILKEKSLNCIYILTSIKT